MNRSIRATTLTASLLFAVASVHAGVPSSDRMANGKSIHGEVAAATPNARVVNVDAGKAINVNCGDVVTFQSAGKSFTWKFNSTAHRALDVREIAPQGFSDKKLMVYVSRNDAEGA
ncbi:CzcE family metal-binding protein [Roseateles sp.]|uniref:CzcE family metal-binding protein n=1 Tax=Roseateles sp. TaxID=1971397 RepID=UPI0039E7F1DB